ncbi:MAG: DNA-processing protein DprA [Acetobacteraceae bacterium]|nr:DNA-processing protein DprA [Acetobacteraceae bacterium]
MSEAPLPPPVGSEAEALARLCLARTEGIGPVGFRRLLAREGSAAAALERIARQPSWGGRDLAPPSLRQAAEERAALGRLGGRLLFLGDQDYPPRLAQLPDAPPVLSVLGDAAALAAPQVGLVGARAASAAARRLAEDIAEDLAEAGLVVTSGLARGVDAAAHLGALRTGRTIAVVPGGLDRPYPPEHAALQARIAGKGAVVAEAPLGAAPLDRHFPRRNRILAGLVVAVVVIEAAERSGTLITAREAADLGREVYAVPGHPVDPRSAGGNALIKQGAPLVESAADILDLLPPSLLPRPAPIAPPARPASAAAPVDQKEILDLIGETPIAVDDLAARCHLPAADLQVVLADLELAGQVALLPGQRVVRTGSG